MSQMLSPEPRDAEECDVAGIALWVVGTDQAEQCRLSCSVLTTQCPALTVEHCPVELFQDGATAIADADVIEFCHFMTVVLLIIIR